jgi:hypothetical protein
MQKESFYDAIIKNKMKNPNYILCNLCGSIFYGKGNKARHEKSVKHKLADYINNNRFEIERIKPKPEKNEIIVIK